MRIQQPHDSGKKAWKRARCYRAKRSIVCAVFIFIEAITGPLNSIVVRDDYIHAYIHTVQTVFYCRVERYKHNNYMTIDNHT